MSSEFEESCDQCEVLMRQRNGAYRSKFFIGSNFDKRSFAYTALVKLRATCLLTEAIPPECGIADDEWSIGTNINYRLLTEYISAYCQKARLVPTASSQPQSFSMKRHRTSADLVTCCREYLNCNYWCCFQAVRFPFIQFCHKPELIVIFIDYQPAFHCHCIVEGSLSSTYPLST